MSNLSKIYITELLFSKLCHDLISPVNAVHNGIELLKEEPLIGQVSTTEIIEKSSKQVLRELSFYRLTYGCNGGRASFNIENVNKNVEDFLLSKEIKLDWEKQKLADKKEIARDEAKLILYSIHLASECLPRGGKITLNAYNSEQPASLIIEIAGERCILRGDVKVALSNNVVAEDLTVGNILAHLINTSAQEMKKSLQVIDQNEGKLTILIRSLASNSSP